MPTDLENRHFVCKVKFVMSGRSLCWGGRGFTHASTRVLQVRLKTTFDRFFDEKRRVSLRFSSLVLEVVQLQSSSGTTCVCQQVVETKLGRSCEKGVSLPRVLLWRSGAPIKIKVDGPSERRRLFHCWNGMSEEDVRTSLNVETNRRDFNRTSHRRCAFGSASWCD